MAVTVHPLRFKEMNEGSVMSMQGRSVCPWVTYWTQPEFVSFLENKCEIKWKEDSCEDGARSYVLGKVKQILLAARVFGRRIAMEKIPDLARNVEFCLYVGTSREMYFEMETLQQRVVQVLRRINKIYHEQKQQLRRVNKISHKQKQQQKAKRDGQDCVFAGSQTLEERLEKGKTTAIDLTEPTILKALEDREKTVQNTSSLISPSPKTQNTNRRVLTSGHHPRPIFESGINFIGKGHMTYPLKNLVVVKVPETITNFTVVDNNKIKVKGSNEIGSFKATGLFNNSTGTTTLYKEYKNIAGRFELEGELTATETIIQFKGKWSAPQEQGGEFKWKLKKSSSPSTSRK